jgi:5-methyltetrahydrofolate--homocysteine methyltransferase
MVDPVELYQAILSGSIKQAEEITRAALEKGTDPSELLHQHMIPAMDEVGRRYNCDEFDFALPEMIIASEAMKSALRVLSPHLARSGVERAGRVVIGTVEGDMHDIGKNLVASMLEGGGFEVTDLGREVLAGRFVEAAREKEGTIVAMSALLTTTMVKMKEVIAALEAAGIREKTVVLVGGAPVTQEFADKIGADGYSDNASGAVALARQLLAK